MKKELINQYKIEVCDKSNKIDPYNEMDWRDLTFGWAIGKGLNIEDAYKFSLDIDNNGLFTGTEG